MAGCTKADRKRKSAANVIYKSSNRKTENSKKAIAKHVKLCFNKVLNVPHGTARAKRREHMQKPTE